jgi:hypothetical protein
MDTLESIRKEKDALTERLLMDYGRLESEFETLKQTKDMPKVWMFVVGLVCFLAGLLIGNAAWLFQW